MYERPGRRWAQALATLALVERRSTALTTAARWRQVVTAGPDAYLLPGAEALPPSLAPSGSPTRRPLRAPVSADLVQLGKFDRGRQVRMRAFYGAAGISVRVQAASRDAAVRHGVARSVTAAQVVAAHRPDLMPRMVDHGTVLRGRTAYLTEETVTGRMPQDPAEVAVAMTGVARELGAVQRAVGITARPLGAVAHPRFAERWRAVVAGGHLSPALGAEVERLIARDARLEVSFTHGDLVSSNVFLDDDRIVLIDWEYAGEQPIAFDLAKMHINAGPAGPATDALDGALEQTVGHDRGHYTLVEQLALAHAVVLSRLEARLVRARQAGRLGPLERQTRKRALALRELLAMRG
ncbi:phosphotransferase [Georgenia sp. MJ173]|uniref:phosphotransferase n=1 Tax=Georgenia sunbinii TaxID=3117728 RepID=UPI002F263457